MAHMTHITHTGASVCHVCHTTTMAHMAHTGRVLAGRVLAGRVLAHTAHALVLRGPAPWCCAAARPCALVLRPGSAEAGVAGPSG